MIRKAYVGEVIFWNVLKEKVLGIDGGKEEVILSRENALRKGS